MVYANQQESYDAIAASTSQGQSGPFIDFMLGEIMKTLQRSICDKVPDKVPNKVPNKSEQSILRLLSENPRMTRVELAKKIGISENGVKKIIANLKASGWIQAHGEK